MGNRGSFTPVSGVIPPYLYPCGNYHNIPYQPALLSRWCSFSRLVGYGFVPWRVYVQIGAQIGSNISANSATSRLMIAWYKSSLTEINNRTSSPQALQVWIFMHPSNWNFGFTIFGTSLHAQQQSNASKNVCDRFFLGVMELYDKLIFYQWIKVTGYIENGDPWKVVPNVPHSFVQKTWLCLNMFQHHHIQTMHGLARGSNLR